jgi:hypothetical protein
VPRVLIACLVLAAAVAAAPATASAPSRAKGRDVTVLFGQALSKVRADPDFAKAVMLEADGTPNGNKPVDNAGQIASWRFVLDNQRTQGSDFASVTISYRRSSGFGTPDGNPSPFLDDVQMPKAPKMTLKRAVSLLDKAGFRDGFENVALRDPLGPDSTAPLYIFGLADNSFVGVNTKTGKVKPLS